MSKILIADDNKELCTILYRSLKKRGYLVEVAEDGEQAVNKVNEDFFDVLVTDLRIPKVDGMEILRKTKDVSPATMVIVITAFGTVENAVEAMKEGAFDYILKPFSSDEIEIKIKHALERQRLGMENEFLRESIQTRFGPIIGSSESMKTVYKLVDKVAPTTAPVLILGRSGTGKELVAREIHKRSDRKDGPFVAVNCVALASGVLESELFGHEKGSFTGAVSRRRGKFEVADGGTLFLDEIGELSEEIQVKLLRFLQEKEFQRVGGNENVKVNVRVLAATNRNLHEEVTEGRFREDLFYRLNMFTIMLPALNERSEDLYELANHFLCKYNKELHKNLKISPEIVGVLKNHDWPGNVRELENVIAQAVILADGDMLEASHLPGGFKKAKASNGSEVSINESSGVTSQIEAIEAEMVKRALEETNWNQVKAAEKLGLKRTTLQYKMQKFGLKSPKAKAAKQ